MLYGLADAMQCEGLEEVEEGRKVEEEDYDDDEEEGKMVGLSRVSK